MLPSLSDGISQTKLDSGFLSPLPKSTPGAGAEEEDAPVCVTQPQVVVKVSEFDLPVVSS